MLFIKGYMDNEKYRHELNDLTRKTFGFDFEKWYTNGHYVGGYTPYSFERDGQVIANASANDMFFNINGIEKYFIQIGTVMTDEAYRNQGLAKSLIEKIIEDYKPKCQGIYLFANLKALGFYEKLGFKRLNETKYFLNYKVKPLKYKFARCNDKEKYESYIKIAYPNSDFSQLHNYGLQMFYTSDMDNVYFSEDLDCFICLDKEGDTCFLNSVISKNKLSILDVVEAIDEEYSNLELGFKPLEEDLKYFKTEVYDGSDDYRLFYIGEELKVVESEKLYFPVYSRA